MFIKLNTGRIIFCNVILFFYSCSGQSQHIDRSIDQTKDSIIIQKRLIDSLVAIIDENYDPLHSDYTPSVHKLSTLGIPAIEAVLPLLNSPKEDTRLHAIRIVEGVISRLHGFIPGQGYTIKAGEDTVRSILNSINYNWEDTVLEKRNKSIERLKIWISKNEKSYFGQ